MPLSKQERERWSIDGYLLLKGILSKAEVRSLSREIDRLYRRHVTNNPDAKPGTGLDRRNVLPDSQAFIDLMDHPKAFRTILELMGPYIQLSMAEAIVRPPGKDFKGYIHTDGGQALRRIRVTETSWPLQLKIQYFLTDVKKPFSGNFTLFPGSHLRPYPEGDTPVTAETEGAVQICAEAGDAAIFPHSTWHGVSPNRSNRSRKTLIYCYSQQCFRTFDWDGHSEEVMAKCTKKQRRLLGDIGEWKPGAYFYSPADQEKVILRGRSPKKTV